MDGCSSSVRRSVFPLTTAESQAGESDRIQQLLQRIDQLEASQKSMQKKIDSLQAAKPAEAPPVQEASPETLTGMTKQ